jgi:hypothetical protein
VSDDVLRVNIWSGPRNVSTALMYSFAQRADTRVVDEPLYAHYLRVSGADHPGRIEVLAAQSQDGEAVVRDVILGPCDRPVVVFKQMAHHLVELDHAFLEQTKNVLLTRDPERMLASLSRVLPHPDVEETGLPEQVRLLRLLRELGQDPAVLDAKRLLADPRGVLTRLCERLGLTFEQGMLHWEVGPRAEDGVWSHHWYGNVHRSTGFQPYRDWGEPVPERLAGVLAECQPLYDELLAAAL